MLAGQDLIHHLQLITSGFGQHKASSTPDPPTEPAVDHHWQRLLAWSACARGEATKSTSNCGRLQQGYQSSMFLPNPECLRSVLESSLPGLAFALSPARPPEHIYFYLHPGIWQQAEIFPSRNKKLFHSH